ncbi:large conductance mechanosensitive channel protein MscL [Lyngbya confervoides]|uniref:Large-conductance mechanosensitive channel n=1 Tax=Lyngbya confervoides BDU141951 TaxID=1574623 RepID=A0ABD4T680_9CYAN|nr:large conductance mechanosensitive channel protein MscL [Lyngbya confervoides]MCM1984213.1 large conductance mechanosensitive channel protein MscL [Lyngbya confervoides BDU141951]
MTANYRQRANGFFSDFKDFLMRGNVLDLAIAVVIGGAFGKIVTSLVEDVLTPAILNPAMKAAKVEELAQLQFNSIKYGSFLAAVLNFIVIAFVIFLVIRSFEAAQRRLQRQQTLAEEAAPPDPQQQLVEAMNRLTQAIERQS